MITATTFMAGRWDEDEHERYLQAMDPFLSWDHVARHVGTRTPIQCRSHNQKILKKIEKAKKRGVVRAPSKEHRLPTRAIAELTERYEANVAVATKEVAVGSPPRAAPPISPYGVDDTTATAWTTGLQDLGADTTHTSLNFDDAIFVGLEEPMDLDALLDDVPDTEQLPLEDMKVDTPIA